MWTRVATHHELSTVVGDLPQTCVRVVQSVWIALMQRRAACEMLHVYCGSLVFHESVLVSEDPPFTDHRSAIKSS